MVLVALRLGGATARAVGVNLPVDVDRARDALDASATNSPVVVANPRQAGQLFLVSRIDTPRFGCAMYASDDGGSTWQPIVAPAPPASHVMPCFAPDAAFGPDGTLYVSFTSGGPVEGQGMAPDGVWMTTSHDGGRTFTTPAQAGGPLAFQVRLAADPQTSGRIYLAWLQAAATARWGLVGTANPIVATRSDDHGATWSPAARVSAETRSLVVAPAPVVTAGGELLVAYLDVGDDRLDYHGAHEGRGGEPYPGPWWLIAARSSDGGAAWKESVIDHLVPTQRFHQLFPPTPTVAASGGHAYVAFPDGRLGDADVWLWASTDGGRQWSAAHRVNDARPGDQYVPALAIAPDGRVDVMYYDRRADPRGTRNEVSLQSSADHGGSFGPRIRLSDRSFDSHIGFGADMGMPELGSRLALVAQDGGDLAVWADTRAGTSASTRQDLARAVVAIAPGSRWRGPFMAAGVVVVAMGLVLGGLAGHGRGRERS